MPQSKHRKKPTIRKKRIVVKTAEDESSKKVRIRPPQFTFLKSNPDFHSLVRVGRLVNVLAFGMQAVYDSMNDKSPVGQRQYHRGAFIIAGYLHEGILLVQNLRADYHSEEFFRTLKDLAYNQEYDLQRKILKEVRDSVAFHLDWSNTATKSALENLKLQRYDLASGDSDTVGDFYFDLADTVDLNYLIDTLKGDRSEEDVVVDIYRTIAEFMKQFLGGGHEFLMGLSEKLKLHDYTE